MFCVEIHLYKIVEKLALKWPFLGGNAHFFIKS